MDTTETELIDAIYGAVATPQAWATAIELLRNYFNVQGAVFGIYDHVNPELADPKISLSVTSGAWSDAAMNHYRRHYWQHDPAPGKMAHVPVGTFESSENWFTAAELRKMVFVNEFLYPLDLAECIGGQIVNLPGGFSAISLLRSRRRAPFGQADFANLQRIVPHLTRAFQLRRKFALLDLKANLLATMADRLPVGIIALSDDDQPIHVNKAALEFAARKDGLRIDVRGNLRAHARAADERLQDLVRLVQRGGSGGIVRIPREGKPSPYAVLIAPLPPGTGLITTEQDGRCGVLLLIHDPDATIPSHTQILAATFGLTQRGAELAAALTAGEDLAEFADRNAVSLNTVRFHLKSVFARMGVRTQAQMVRMAVRTLLEFSVGSDRPQSLQKSK